MYADTITKSMKAAIDETSRRRAIQEEYNKKNNIIPRSVEKDISDNIEIVNRSPEILSEINGRSSVISAKERKILIEKLTREMNQASRTLDFEYAAVLRDKIFKLKEEEK
jgi:excinuclease ABC subunit B